MFKKVLIANRGEIALRVMWACKELGLKTVAVYSEADANGLTCASPTRRLHRAAAQHRVVPQHPAIISAGRDHGRGRDPSRLRLPLGVRLPRGDLRGVQHQFIGPGPQAIRLMGDKSRAKKAMIKAGVPVVPGSPGCSRTKRRP
jgi:acetyl-CoA carboxylase biotin carboxylase subunit